MRDLLVRRPSAKDHYNGLRTHGFEINVDALVGLKGIFNPVQVNVVPELAIYSRGKHAQRVSAVFFPALHCCIFFHESNQRLTA